MVGEPLTIEVDAGIALDRLLDEAAGRPLRHVRGSERFRLDREADDLRANSDPERAIAGMRAAEGKWADLDPEALKEAISRWREEDTRPPDRP